MEMKGGASQGHLQPDLLQAVELLGGVLTLGARGGFPEGGAKEKEKYFACSLFMKGSKRGPENGLQVNEHQIGIVVTSLLGAKSYEGESTGQDSHARSHSEDAPKQGPLHSFNGLPFLSLLKKCLLF